MLLSKKWVNNEIKKIKSYLKTNKNEHSTTQSLWGTAKAILRKMLIALQAYFKKKKKFKINNLTLHLNN